MRRLLERARLEAYSLHQRVRNAWRFGFAYELEGAIWVCSEAAPVRFAVRGPAVFGRLEAGGSWELVAVAVMPRRYAAAVAIGGDVLEGVGT